MSQLQIESTSGPIRVYYGNPSATAPHYDLGAKLPADLDVTPVRLSPQAQQDNPVYTPGARPFSERAPWVVYIVLGVAVLVLAWILLGLVRQSAARVPA